MKQHPLYRHEMNYGQRLSKAMEGRFATNAMLADALTRLLREQNRIAANKVIPEETISSARKRITAGGQSKYTLDFARLCEVDPYWLAYEIGEMRGPPVTARVAESVLGYDSAGGILIKGVSRERWRELTEGQRRKIEGEVIMMIEDMERKNQGSDVGGTEERSPLQRP